MSYSAHRAGRMGSDGRIEFDVPIETEPPIDMDAPIEVPETADDFDVPDWVSEPQATQPTEPITEPAAAGDAEQVTEPLDDFEREFEQTPEPEPAPAATRAERKTRAPRPKGSRLRRLAILGGADGGVLDRVPSETPRFVQMFFVLLGTAVVSAISMMFALLTGVQIGWWFAIPLAVVWAGIIFNLDRFLTSSMKSSKNVWKLVALAFPRVVLAAVIGIVVAEPLVLQIFHNDISREVNATNVVQAQADQEALQTGPEKIALDAARERLDALENQAATGIVAGTSTDSAASVAAQATIDKLNQQLSDQQAVIDQARAIYQCELTGDGAGEVDGCSGVAGEGVSSESAQSQLTQAQASYDALAAKLQEANDELAAAEASGNQATADAETQNRADANDALPEAREAYQAALAAYNEREDAVASGNAGATGLLSQMSGLSRLSEREPILGFAHILIALLFFLIELLPVIVKVLTSYGEKSLYEKAEEIDKQVALDRVTADGWQERAEITRRAGQRIDATA